MNLSELKELRKEYIQQAVNEQVPQKLKMIAGLGECYLSNRHGLYQIFPVLYQDKTAVIVNHPTTGKFIDHGIWEFIDRLFVYITKRFDPKNIDKYSQLPIFWSGYRAVRWELSDRRIEPLKSDIFIPGDWWASAQQYLPDAKDRIAKEAQEKQVEELHKLMNELLIGVEI